MAVDTVHVLSKRIRKVQSFTSSLKIKEYQLLVITVLGILSLCLKGLDFCNLIKFCFVKQIKILGRHRNSVLHCGDHSNCIHQDWGKKNLQIKTLFYLTLCLQQLQEMDERRTIKLSECYKGFADSERKVIPIISKCLEGMILAAKSVDEHRVSRIEWLL